MILWKINAVLVVKSSFEGANINSEISVSRSCCGQLFRGHGVCTSHKPGIFQFEGTNTYAIVNGGISDVIRIKYKVITIWTYDSR
jgi:hypothetical protein